MEGNDEDLSAKVFRDACRKEFTFLAELHNFKETAPIDWHGPDQIVFEKQGWKIMIAGIGHGTGASVVIVSPEGQPGFLSHLIPREFEIEKRLEFDKSQNDDLSFQAFCLQKFGSKFLDGDWSDFEILQQRQQQMLIEKGLIKGLA
jgi:hypothetical protein